METIKLSAIQKVMLLLLVLLLFELSAGEITICAVLPHGDFAYAPELVDGKNGAKELYDSVLSVVKEIKDSNPEVIFVSSPHGVAHSTDFTLYQNEELSGTAYLGQDLANSSYIQEINLSASTAGGIVSKLLTELSKDHNVSGLSGFGSYPFPLGWGEVLPLHAIYDQMDKIPVVVLSQPSRRQSEPQKMVPELLKLGSSLFKVLDGFETRIAVIASCDLAHTHLSSGPYGYSPAAAPFDIACSLWAETINGFALLNVAKTLVNEALSCGFTSLVMLHGLLKENINCWRPKLYSVAHPTYYGMLVASFQRIIPPISVE